MANNKFCCPHCGEKQPFRKLLFGLGGSTPCVRCGTVIHIKEGYIGYFRYLLIIAALIGVDPIESALMAYYPLPNWGGMVIFVGLLSLAVLLNLWIVYITSTFE